MSCSLWSATDPLSLAYAAFCLSLSSKYRFGGDPGQFLHGLTWMSLSKFEIQSFDILIKK